MKQLYKRSIQVRMEHQRAIDKLTVLERRIADTAERFVELKAQYEALQSQKASLQRELDDLRSVNDELTDKINYLKSIQDQNVDSFNKEEVRKRIDRVLEKFGEIQL